MSPDDAAFATVLAGLLALTVVANLPGRLGARLRRADAAGLLVQSSYFAPRPGRYDYVVVRRYESPDGALSAWRELHGVRPHRWSRPVFNPARRINKALADLTRNLGEFREANGDDALRLSLPYLALLNAVSHAPRDVPAAAVQFAVLGMAGPDDVDPGIVMVSDLHPVA